MPRLGSCVGAAGGDYAAVGRRLDVLVKYHLAHAVAIDVSVAWILDTGDMSVQPGTHVRVLEGQVGISAEGAVLEHQVVAVAQGLGAGDMAVDKAQAVRIPTEVLAVQLAVAHSDTHGVPQGVFAVNLGVTYQHVVTVLEGIIAVLLVSVDDHMVGVHKQVVGIEHLDIFEGDIAAMPQGFLRIWEFDTADIQPFEFTEHLGRFDTAVAHHAVSAVPQRGTGALGEIAAFDLEVACVPEWVLAAKLAMTCHDITRCLQSALAGIDDYVFQLQIVSGEQRPFAPVFLILYLCLSHNLISLLRII